MTTAAPATAPIYDSLIQEIEESVALRGILPAESEILTATCEREKAIRVEPALTPEHAEAQGAWRAFGDWFRAKRAPTRKPRRAATAPIAHRFPMVDLASLTIHDLDIA